MGKLKVKARVRVKDRWQTIFLHNAVVACVDLFPLAAWWHSTQTCSFVTAGWHFHTPWLPKVMIFVIVHLIPSKYPFEKVFGVGLEGPSTFWGGTTGSPEGMENHRQIQNTMQIPFPWASCLVVDYGPQGWCRRCYLGLLSVGSV